MTRKKHAEHANHERWLVSYADFITLLFAFFVVMFATSKADKHKASQVSESLKKALDQSEITTAVQSIMGGAVADKGRGNAQLKGPGGFNTTPLLSGQKIVEQKAVELLPSLKILQSQLHDEIAAGKLEVHLEERGLVISFRQASLFPSGTDDISPSAYKSVNTIAQAMMKLPNPARLEGHTDSIPIHNARFRSNWDLSAARSIALLDLLSDKFGVPAEKLSVGGYGGNAPLDTNDTEEGRARNRRVDVVILSEMGLEAEPGKRAP